ncbi:NAD(P)H-dependent oxidoreductase [Serratia ureilytica]
MSDQALKIVTLLGSLRKGSTTPWWLAPCQGLLHRASPVKRCPPSAISRCTTPTCQGEGFPAAVQAIAEQIRQADGVIIVTPEYNYSVPGGLKNAIDWLSRLPNQPLAKQAGRHSDQLDGADRRRALPIPPAPDPGVPRCDGDRTSLSLWAA